jgi:hypothetical protein
MLTGGPDTVTCDSLRNGNEEEERKDNDNARDRHERDSSQDSLGAFAGLFTTFESSSLRPLTVNPVACPGVWPSSAMWGFTTLYRILCPSACRVFMDFHPHHPPGNADSNHPEMQQQSICLSATVAFLSSGRGCLCALRSNCQMPLLRLCVLPHETFRPRRHLLVKAQEHRKMSAS